MIMTTVSDEKLSMWPLARASAAVQLTERSLLTPEVHTLNPTPSILTKQQKVVQPFKSNIQILQDSFAFWATSGNRTNIFNISKTWDTLDFLRKMILKLTPETELFFRSLFPFLIGKSVNGPVTVLTQVDRKCDRTNFISCFAQTGVPKCYNMDLFS